eukprot:1812645-Amphidinium_carterae.1
MEAAKELGNQSSIALIRACSLRNSMHCSASAWERTMPGNEAHLASCSNVLVWEQIMFFHDVNTSCLMKQFLQMQLGQ